MATITAITPELIDVTGSNKRFSIIGTGLSGLDVYFNATTALNTVSTDTSIVGEIPSSVLSDEADLVVGIGSSVSTIPASVEQVEVTEVEDCTINNRLAMIVSFIVNDVTEIASYDCLNDDFTSTAVSTGDLSIKITANDNLTLKGAKVSAVIDAVAVEFYLPNIELERDEEITLYAADDYSLYSEKINDYLDPNAIEEQNYQDNTVIKVRSSLNAVVCGTVSNSYVSKVALTEYEEKISDTYWSALTDYEKDNLIKRATVIIDSDIYYGEKITTSQRLEFPRMYMVYSSNIWERVCAVNMYGKSIYFDGDFLLVRSGIHGRTTINQFSESVSGVSVPVSVADACFELARAYARNGVDNCRQDLQNMGVRSRTIDDISETYAGIDASKPFMTGTAKRLLAKYICKIGRIV